MSKTKIEKLLVVDFKKILDKKKKTLRLFSHYGFGSEGWLKTELINFFDMNKLRFGIEEIYQEVRFPIKGKNKVVDLVLKSTTQLKSKFVCIELKQWGSNFKQRTKTYKKGSIEFGKNQIWDIRNTFSSQKNCTFKKILELRQEFNANIILYLLILFTNRPSKEEWASGVAYLKEHFLNKFISLSDPKNFPEEYFIALFKVI